MKFSLFIDPERDEEVIVYAHKRCEKTQKIQQLAEDTLSELICYNGTEGIVVPVDDIFCVFSNGDNVYVMTEKEQYKVKQRLYQLYEKLSLSFVKINQSCIVNINKIQKFDATIAGSLTVKLKNGYKDYVSRRQLKEVKERIGLKI